MSIETKEKTTVPPERKNQLVDGVTLLQELFPENARPSQRWLYEQKKLHRIPFVKIGRLIFYSPTKVKETLEARMFGL